MPSHRQHLGCPWSRFSAPRGKGLFSWFMAFAALSCAGTRIITAIGDRGRRPNVITGGGRGDIDRLHVALYRPPYSQIEEEP
jgi:hypothetical protein